MHRESFSPEYGRHDPEPADGNSPLRQVLAAPGGWRRAIGLRRRRTRMCWGVPGWAKYGAAARSPVHSRENLKVVSFAANSRVTMAIWAAGAGALPGHLSPGRPESHSRLSSPFSGIPAVSIFPQAGRLARERVRPAAAIRAGAGIQGPRRGMIDTVRIRGRPPRSDLMCHAGRRGHQLPDISSSIALK